MGPLTKEPYQLDPDFEKLVLYFMATSPKFWNRVGHAIDGDCLDHPLGKLVAAAVRQVAKDTGHGPDGPVILVQRLMRLVSAGKVALADVRAVSDLLDEVEDAFCPLPPADAVADEILPVLRRQLHRQSVIIAMDEYAKGTDFAQVAKAVDRARRLGQGEKVGGVRLGQGSFDVIEKARSVQRLSTGIVELDIQLNGGKARKTLTIWVGDSGAGKSIALVHGAGESVRRQLFTGFVTLELPEHVQLARLKANLTGLPTNDILDSDAVSAEAKRRLSLVEHMLGLCEVVEFSPHVSSVRDIVEWIDEKEQEHGAKMQALFVDYADKLTDPRGDPRNDYTMMRFVYEALRRDVAMERDMWVDTASQATRPTKESSRRLDMHHVSDSMHKIRVGDLVVTLNPKDDGMLEAFVAKHRLGRSRFSVGPLPVDFERGRLVPWARELAAW